MFGLINANMINHRLKKIMKVAVAGISSCFFMASCENNVNDVKNLEKEERWSRYWKECRDIYE
jgi:hypothetical protein